MIMNQPLVSVILPCYNAMPFLPMALDSIIHQTYTNLEIICINDGSNDETPAVLEAYAKKDNRIRVIHNETNLKLIGTLNKAIGLAKGEYIARMDADDISHLERIERLLSLLIKENMDVVSCNSEFIDMQGKKISTAFLKAITPIEIQFASYFFTPIGHPNLLSRKELFQKYTYSTESNAYHTEDYELWTRMLRNGVQFFNSDEVLYSYRFNDHSVSRKFEEIQKSNFVKNAQVHQETLLKRELNREVVCVAVNRMDNISTSNFKAGFKLIDETLIVFIQKEKPTKQEIKSLRFIVATQKTDIAIQGLKIGNFKLRVVAGITLFGLVLSNVFKTCYWKNLLVKF